MAKIDLLTLMTGVDIPIPECNLILHQPTLKEIAMIGEKAFFEGVQIICLSKETLGDEVPENCSNFNIFMTVMTQKQVVKKKKKVFDSLSILFPNIYFNLIPPRSMVFKLNNELKTIDENNFEILQAYIRELFLSDIKEIEYNPVNEKAKKIADKLKRGRKKVQEIKAQENQEKDEKSFAQYISIITVGIPSMSLQDTLNLTLFQMKDLMERFSLYLNWDSDMKVRLAGGKPDKEPDNWMKNLYE